MNISLALRISALSSLIVFASACTVDKLEARLQADPQCKSVMNAKTGALMPCPGTDKEFYKSVPALNMSAQRVSPATEVKASAVSTLPMSASSPKATIAPVECKPQLHQKSGSLMPCPAP